VKRGLALLVLAERIGAKPSRLGRILGQEVQAGRVVHEAGGYRLAPEAFSPGTVEALRDLSLS
jgi:hypothetical protein